MRWGALCIALAGCLSKPTPLPPGSGDGAKPIIGRTWAQRMDANPPPQPPPAMLNPKLVYDATRGHVVMYGGDDAITTTYFPGMWELDETGWETICNPCGPLELVGQGMAYDRKRGVIVMYGGYNESAAVASVWEFDSQWHQRSDGPTTLQNLQMVYDESTSTVLAFGGFTDDNDTQASNAMYGYDGTSWTPLSSHASVADSNTVAAYDGRNGLVYSTDDVGDGAVFTNGIDAFDGTSWSPVCGGPCSTDPRNDSAMVYDRGLGTILWIGGYSQMDGRIGHVASLDANGSEFDVMPPDPALPGREGWGVAYDEGRDVVVLYGGRTDAGPSCGGTCDEYTCICAETWEGAPVYGD